VCARRTYKLVGWLIACLFVCWPSRFGNSTVPTWGFLVSFSVSSSLISMHFSFTSSNTQVLGKCRGVMMLHHTVDLYDHGTTCYLHIHELHHHPWHKIQTNFKSIARHNVMHFWSDSIFFIRCSQLVVCVWWSLPKSFSAISPLGKLNFNHPMWPPLWKLFPLVGFIAEESTSVG